MTPDMVRSQLNQTKTLTENGAVAYETSGHALLDFNFALSVLRNATERQIREMYSKAFYENPHAAVKFLFWLRDCRGGAGERRIFRVCLMWLTETRPKIIQATLSLIPEYGRVDDIWQLLDTDLRDGVISLIRETVVHDRLAMTQGKPISLTFKWLPSSNASSRETKRLAEIIQEGLGMTPRQYRKMLSAGREYLDVVERKMSSSQWSDIKYEAVPSKANLIYRNAFMRHDEERRRAYLESLQKGETKINASVLQPHEIVGKYFTESGYWGVKVNPEIDSVLEELWKALPDVTIGDTIVVEDTSGSMTSGYGTDIRPIDVATALAIYMSEHNEGVWRDKIISFSTNPQLLDMSNCDSLREKVAYIMDTAEVSNTDIEKTMLLILNTALANNCTQDEMPGTILILSDCQWDQMTRIRSKNPNKSLFDNLAREFEAHGYKLPKIVFWNLSGAVNRTIPIQQNDLGVILMSGFSVQLLNMAMSSKVDPYEALLETINAPRYDAVEEALKGIV